MEEKIGYVDQKNHPIKVWRKKSAMQTKKVIPSRFGEKIGHGDKKGHPIKVFETKIGHVD